MRRVLGSRFTAAPHSIMAACPAAHDCSLGHCIRPAAKCRRAHRLRAVQRRGHGTAAAVAAAIEWLTACTGRIRKLVAGKFLGYATQPMLLSKGALRRARSMLAPVWLDAVDGFRERTRWSTTAFARRVLSHSFARRLLSHSARCGRGRATRWRGARRYSDGRRAESPLGPLPGESSSSSHRVGVLLQSLRA